MFDPFTYVDDIIIFSGMHHAHIFRELLLAIHVSVRIGKHDSGFHRAASVRVIPDTRVPEPLRIHGPDDHVPKLRSPRGKEVRSHAQLGPKQNQIQNR